MQCQTFTLGTMSRTAEPTLPAYRQVAAAITEQIVSGAITPGVRLPAETELAAEFGVSRSTIREALRAVSSQGLVTTARGVKGGTFVSQPETADVTAALELGIGLLTATDQVTVDELLEVREVLEVPATRIAAQRITPEMLRQLEMTVSDGAESTFDQHKEFHVTVLTAAGNRMLEAMTTPIFEVLRTRFLRDTAPEGFWMDVKHDHDRIAYAIRNNDADTAADAMLSHLRNLRPTYVAIDRAHIR